MTIVGLTVCVGDQYAELLEQSLGRWIDGLDNLIVVTDMKDELTAQICQNKCAVPYRTNRFYEDGAMFNKGGAISEAAEFFLGDHWCLLFDADIMSPVDFREKIEAANPIPGNLYGTRRYEGSPDRLLPDGEIAGYFMLFHGTDPNVRRKPFTQSYTHAGCYDSELMLRWPGERRKWLNMPVEHVGLTGKNWCGIGNDAAMQQLIVNRCKPGWNWRVNEAVKP